tara:strand:- start:5857 stop:6003 length:147 start_codon:yes stop_codon:yes gene_type:complete
LRTTEKAPLPNKNADSVLHPKNVILPKHTNTFAHCHPGDPEALHKLGL